MSAVARGRVPYLVEAWEERMLAAHPALRDAFDDAIRQCDAFAERLLAAEELAADGGREWDDERFDDELRRMRIASMREYADRVRGIVPPDAHARWVRLLEIGGVTGDHPFSGADVDRDDTAVLGTVALWAATELETLPSQQYDPAQDPCECGYLATGRIPKQLCGRCGVEQAQAWLAEERRLLDGTSGVDAEYRAEVNAIIDACTHVAATFVRADEHGYGPPMTAEQEAAADRLRVSLRRHRRAAKGVDDGRWSTLADVVSRHYSRDLAKYAKRASKLGLGIAHIAMLSEWHDDRVQQRLMAMAAADIDAGIGSV